MRSIITFVCIAVAGVALAAPAAKKAGDAAAGKTLFAAKCVTCHAKDAKGNPAMAKMFKIDLQKLDLTGEEAQKLSVEELGAIITTGRNKMPSFKGKLQEADVANAAAYIKSLGAPAKPAAAK